MAFVDAYRAGIEAIDGLQVLGRPQLSIVAFDSDRFDVLRIAETMAAKGWLPGLLHKPKAIHRMMSMLHAASLAEYLADVRSAIGEIHRAEAARPTIRATY
jgi:hypothetical protein